MKIAPRSIIHADPRRRRRHLMLSVWCWCGRFYTVTPEQARRFRAMDRNPCPECGPATEVAA